jgi:hypothetical protein
MAGMRLEWNIQPGVNARAPLSIPLARKTISRLIVEVVAASLNWPIVIGWGEELTEA